MAKSKAYGTKFLRSPDGIAPYLQIAGVVDMEPPAKARDTRETTNLDGSNDPNGYRSFLGSLKDGGEMSLTLEWDESDVGQVALHADFESDDPGYYEIEYPEGTTVTFEALVTEIGSATPLEDRVTRPVSFKLTGAHTIA